MSRVDQSAPIRIGVVGCGYWGPNLIRNFAGINACQVVAAADIDIARLEGLRRHYPQLDLSTDPNQLLQRVDIDAVAVVTPVATHFSLARMALECGKHVLVEKPLAETVGQADELVQLARESERILMVDHTFVYSGPVRKIRELIGSGEIGDVLYVDSVRINLGIFQPDVNVLWDLAPHDFSIICHLLKAFPTAVSAVGAAPVAYSDRSLESIAYATLDFDGRILAHSHLSWLSPVKIRRMLIGGSRKMVVYDHLDSDAPVKVYDKGVSVASPEERHQMLVQRRTGDMYAPKVDQTEALERVSRDFIECILTGHEPVSSGNAGWQIVKLIDAAERSMRQGGGFVAV